MYILSKELNSLELSENIVEKLNKNDINLIEDLWSLKRENLKAMGFSGSEINTIIIKLQLNNLDLNQKHY